MQTDLTMTNHGFLGYMVVVSKLFWKTLNDQQRGLISQAMKESTEYANKLAIELDEKYLADIKASGSTKVHELTLEQRQAWKEKLMPIYPEFYDALGQDLVEGALAAAK